MLRNNIKIAFRNFARQKSYTLLNVIGLSLGMAASLLIIQYVKYERSFDTFHNNAKDIYRIQYNSYSNGKQNFECAAAVPAVGPALKNNFPEVEYYVRMHEDRQTFGHDDVTFKEEHIYYASEDFFKVFSFPLLKGVDSTVLREPDGILTRGAVRLGVAAKRPGGPAHVTRLVRDGAKQLGKAKLSGFVALSLDRVLAPKDALVVARTAEDLKPAAPELLHATVRPLLPVLDAAVVGTPALGLLASLVVVGAATDTNAIGRLSGIFIHAFPHQRPTQQQLELLRYLADGLGRPPEV